MNPRRLLPALAALGIGLAWPIARADQAGAQKPERPVVRFLIASAGGFDQRNFVEEYARGLPGIEMKVASDLPGTGLEALQRDAVDLMINASPLAYMAYSGQLELTTERYDRLRAIANLGVVPLHLVVREDPNIHSIGGLRGRRVSVGAPGGEIYRLAVAVLEAFGLPEGSYERYHPLSYADAAEGLVQGRVDAMFILGGYPGPAVRRAIESGSGRLLPIDGKPADRLRLNSGFLHPTLIPGGVYPDHAQAIRTIGVQHVLVCRRDLDEAVVYELTKQLFVALPRLAAAMSTVRSINVDLASATSIPLHDGAARYYRERELSR
jgi:TRAP transporter TAXI family solute receptor